MGLFAWAGLPDVYAKEVTIGCMLYLNYLTRGTRFGTWQILLVARLQYISQNTSFFCMLKSDGFIRLANLSYMQEQKGLMSRLSELVKMFSQEILRYVLFSEE